MNSHSRDLCNLSPSNHRIYVPFYSKNTATTFIYRYTPHTNAWNRATSIPTLTDNFVLKGFIMVALNHHIYVIGGLLSPNAAEQGDGVQERVVPYVRRYDVGTGTWETCASMSTPRIKFACIVSDDKIYVAGGQCTSGRAEGLSSAEVYDPVLDQWRSMADMSLARYNCVGVTWKGKIHVIGGFVSGDVVARSSAETYDENCKKWEFLPRMWDLDTPPNQIVSVNQKLFSSGDCLRPWKGYISVYDEIEKIWIAVHGSNFDFPKDRLYLTMTPIENQLYFVVGSRQRLEVHVFDTAEDGEGWRSFEPTEEDEEEKVMCGNCCLI